MFSVPAVAGETVFIGSCAGVLYALDKKSGAVRWSYDIGKDGKQRSFHGNPLITKDLILIGTDYNCAPDGIGHVYAFETDSGKVRWKYRSTSVPTDIVPIGSNVYFGSFQDRWAGVNLTSGKELWTFSTGTTNEDCNLPKAPVADTNHLYIAGLDGVIYSLDAASGRVAWKRQLSAPASTALAFNNGALIFGTADKRIHRLDPESGRTLAEMIVEATPFGRPANVDKSLIFFLESSSPREGYLISTDTALGRILWAKKAPREWASERPHVWNEMVIAGNCRGELAAFRISDGSPEWTLNLTGCIRSIGSEGDTLFVGVQEGTVYALQR